MALREEFRSSGEWLFRWRSYIPLVPLTLVLGVLLTSYRYPGGSHHWDRVWEMFCFGVSLLGLGVRVLTVGHVPADTSGRNTARGQLASTLNSSGIYSTVRHPLYLGNYLMWLGLLLFPRSWSVVALVTMFYWLYYERIMFAEEEFLRDRFGAAYLEWAARTPAILPSFEHYTPPTLPFSLPTVLKRELSSLFGLVATFTAAEVASDYGALGVWHLDPLWAGIFVSGLALFLLLVVLKRRRLLEVKGR